VSRVSHAIDRFRVSFDDPNLVANAGLLLVGTLVVRLELERLVNATVRLPGRVGGARPGRKVLTLVHAMVAGASHIDHADILRCGGTAQVLIRVMAPSTLGTFLRAFTFGHVRQLEAVVGEALRRAWSAGGSPGPARLVIDIDSTICEVAGKAKAGAAFGYTKVLGYQPILATRADTGEVCHARMRKGSANTARGARRFIDELVARLHRAGASGEIVMRFDSGFWSKETIVTLGRLGVRYTMAVRTNTKGVAAAIAAMDPAAWVDIEYTPERGGPGGRVHLPGPAPDRAPHPADRSGPGPAVARLAPLRLPHRSRRRCRGHRRVPRDHATVEVAIRDLKEGAGMEHGRAWPPPGCAGRRGPIATRRE
jgi:DDE family transposase